MSRCSRSLGCIRIATASTSTARQARELNLDLSRLGTVLVTRWGAATDAGPVRRRNEDSWLAEPPLYAVADGMGGHAEIGRAHV